MNSKGKRRVGPTKEDFQSSYTLDVDFGPTFSSFFCILPGPVHIDRLELLFSYVIPDSLRPTQGLGHKSTTLWSLV